MRRTTLFVAILLTLGMVGTAGATVLTSTTSANVDTAAAAAVADVGGTEVCAAAIGGTPVYAKCSAEVADVPDPRIGQSKTASAAAFVCRRESTGDECVGATVPVGRTGAEAGPSLSSDGTDVPLPQVCVGTTCTPSGSVTVPKRVTAFNSGTTPEVDVYVSGGSASANAPQLCASTDASCGQGDDLVSVEGLARNTVEVDIP